MHKRYHLQDQSLAVGERVFEERVSLPGLQYRRRNAIVFCHGRDHLLELIPEPTNQYDSAAIAIYGRWRGWFFDKKKQLGYLPREIAGRLKETHLTNTVRPRLLKTYVSTDNYVEIELQIIGPASQYRRYRPLGNSPMDRVQAAKEAGDDTAHIEELVRWIEQTERQSEANGWGVAPKPYLELAKLYRRLKRIDDEITVLQRYERQQKAPGTLPKQLAERLQKALRKRTH